MRKLPLLFLFLITFLNASAQLPILDWVHPVWGFNSVYGRDIAVDNDLNVIGVGQFQGSVEIMGDTSQVNLTVAGISDAYVSKHDRNGNLKWAFSIGSSTADDIHRVVTDDQGNVYCLGVVTNVADLDPGPGVAMLNNPAGSQFLAKYDSLGNFVWLRDYSNVSLVSIDIDDSSNILISGFWTGTFDFDLSPGVFELSCPLNLQKDMFVSKLDSNGDFIWAKQFVNLSWNAPTPYSIETDTSGNVYVSGVYRDTLDADPSAVVQNLFPIGLKDCFVIKLTSTGDYLWSHSFGTTANDDLTDLTVLPDQSICLVGRYPGTMDLDPTAGVQNSTSLGGSDIFITLLSESGGFIWAHSIGGIESDGASSVGADLEDNIYVTGSFKGVIDFDPGPGVAIKSALGNFNSSVYILSLDKFGQFRFVQDIVSVQSNGFVVSQDLETDSLKNIYLCGEFSNTIDFDPDTSSQYPLTHVGTYKAYKHKLSQCYSRDTLNETACNSYTSPSGKYVWTNSGIYNDTIANYLGCDSILLIDLIVEQTNWTDNITACDSFLWMDGNTYVSDTNSATFVIVNPLGCDSIITLNLTLTQSTASIDSHVVCESFTWIDGVTYTASVDSVTFALMNSTGCDSLITLDLTVNHVNTNVSVSGVTITADEVGAMYQWIDCSNNSEINGAIDQVFEPSSNGTYAVIVTDSNCSDTSDCVTINSVGVEEAELTSVFVYPNPNDGKFTLELDGMVSGEAKIEIFNMLGELMFADDITVTGKHTFDLKLAGSGIYHLHVRNANGVFVQPILIR